MQLSRSYLKIYTLTIKYLENNLLLKITKAIKMIRSLTSECMFKLRNCSNTYCCGHTYSGFFLLLLVVLGIKPRAFCTLSPSYSPASHLTGSMFWKSSQVFFLPLLTWRDKWLLLLTGCDTLWQGPSQHTRDPLAPASVLFLGLQGIDWQAALPWLHEFAFRISGGSE